MEDKDQPQRPTVDDNQTMSLTEVVRRNMGRVPNNDGAASAPLTVSTPPMPHPWERLIGEGFKANVVDFSGAFLWHAQNSNHAAIMGQNTAWQASFGQKLLADSQNLAVKITTDAADNAAVIQRALNETLRRIGILGEQNLAPVSQGTGQDMASKADTSNRVVDAGISSLPGAQGVNQTAIQAAVAKQIDATITPTLLALATGIESVQNGLNQVQAFLANAQAIKNANTPTPTPAGQ